MQRSHIPDPPWFEERRCMVVWDDPGAPEVGEYIDRYWEHQVSCRRCSLDWKTSEPSVGFPWPSFVPGLRPRPIAHVPLGGG